ncbi:MAG: hypothetical protein VW872_03810 [Candidatus Poseidoniales archaeon]|jgi:hypothetical protein
MGSLWQFFGLPDPEGSANAPPRAAPPSNDAPVTLSAGAEADSATPAAPEPPATTPTTPSPLSEAAIDLSRLRTPPLGWTGPLTPDGEAFHDLGIEVQRQRPLPNKALRYIAPDVMKRIPTGPMLERVMQGDTAIVDLRPLVHMESHQMACRREIKHMADQARVSVFSLDAEDKLLMVPGHNVVVDMQKHELGLTPLL